MNKQHPIDKGTVLINSIAFCIIFLETSFDYNYFFNKRKNRDNSVQASSAITDSLVELRQKLSSGLTLSEDTLKTLGVLYQQAMTL